MRFIGILDKNNQFNLLANIVQLFQLKVTKNPSTVFKYSTNCTYFKVLQSIFNLFYVILLLHHNSEGNILPFLFFKTYNQLLTYDS